MNELADVLGIIVDGGTLGYAGYRAGRLVWKNRERLIGSGQRIHVTVTDRLRLSDSHKQVLTGGGIPSLAEVGGGTLSVESTRSTSYSVRRPETSTRTSSYRVEAPTPSLAKLLEELASWYLHVS
jgi:hypothetical protein